MWKNDPNVRIGRKNSAASRIVISAACSVIAPLCSSQTAMPMPSAAPPKATRSMIVIELSCIVSTFIVMRRNFSASSFMIRC